MSNVQHKRYIIQQVDEACESIQYVTKTRGHWPDESDTLRHAIGAYTHPWVEKWNTRILTLHGKDKGTRALNAWYAIGNIALHQVLECVPLEVELIPGPVNPTGLRLVYNDRPDYLVCVT